MTTAGHIRLNLRARSDGLRLKNWPWKLRARPEERTGMRIARKLIRQLRGYDVTVRRDSFSIVEVEYKTKE